MNHNRHDLASAQLGVPFPFDPALSQQRLMPLGLEPLAEIIDMAEQFQ